MAVVYQTSEPHIKNTKISCEAKRSRIIKCNVLLVQICLKFTNIILCQCARQTTIKDSIFEMQNPSYSLKYLHKMQIYILRKGLTLPSSGMQINCSPVLTAN